MIQATMKKNACNKTKFWHYFHWQHWREFCEVATPLQNGYTVAINDSCQE
jgi:hypothetical protein